LAESFLKKKLICYKKIYILFKLICYKSNLYK